MSNKKHVVSASISNGQRDLIMRRLTPTFDQVYCYQLTWAYGINQGFAYPSQPLQLTLTGRHIGDGHEALVGKLSDPAPQSSFGTVTNRPDGKMVHITLSTREGVAPKYAGEIDPDQVTPIQPITLTIKLHARAASQLRPQLLAA